MIQGLALFRPWSLDRLLGDGEEELSGEGVCTCLLALSKSDWGRARDANFYFAAHRCTKRNTNCWNNRCMALWG